MRRQLRTAVAAFVLAGGLTAPGTVDRGVWSSSEQQRTQRSVEVEPDAVAGAASAAGSRMPGIAADGRDTAAPAGATRAPESCPPEPHPCGEVWPAGLIGPFGLREVRRVQVESHDGVLLDGWIGLPKLPPGVRAPVVLNSTPYLSFCMVHIDAGCLRNPGAPGWWADGPMQNDQAWAGLGVQPIRWLKRGYAVATFSIRGSGHSGGCFDLGGFAEQKDQSVLVDWLGSQPWSNGRVGMGGLSYPGGTTWQAAVQAPRALKAIVSVAPITNYYEYLFSPQGARHTTNLLVSSTLFPQYSGPSVNDDLAGLLPPLVERAGCPPAATALAGLAGYATATRSSSFFEPRDLMPRLGNVQAAVLHTQGYNDFSHYFQDRAISASLPPTTPVRELRGWFFHEFPNGVHGEKAFTPPPRSGERDWEELVTTWFDHWLKGLGSVPALGSDHQDQLGTWHQSASWPPPEATTVVRSVPDAELVLAPLLTELSLASILFAPELGGGGSLCTAGGPGVPSLSAIASHTAATETVVAGNPHVELSLTSTRPVGLIDAALYAVGPNFTCPAVASPDVRWLAGGGVDLAHHNSRYEAHPFPVGTPTRVRIDLSDVTARIPAGHRLVLVLTDGDFLHIGERDSYPTVVSIHGGGSRLILPILDD